MTQYYEFPGLERDWKKGEEEEYEVAKSRWILDRADFLMDNPLGTEHDVWTRERPEEPLAAFIKNCRGDLLEAAMHLRNAAYAEALKRAREDAEEKSVNQILGIEV